MADVDITSLSVEISAESSGAELNIDKLTTAISNLRAKGNVTKVVNSLDRLSASISALKQASTSLSGLDKLQNFLNGLGNLNVSGSVKSLNSVVNAIKKIPAAVSGLGSVDFYSMSGSITELMNALAPLSILDASGLKAIGSAVNAIGKIPDLSEKLKAADLDAFTASCQKISAALTPLASQLDKVGNAFAKLPPQLSKVVTQANRVTAANQKASKSYMSLSSQVNNFMKRAAQLVSLKALATYIGNAVVKFNDFYEATDLFNNAMGNLGDEASSLVNKMQELLGIDPKDAMEHIATIQSLATSFGLASDKAYILSKNLTQLAYDEASYWNKDSAETFTAISSAISGELEPIRRLGVDLSQARLQQELLALGFNKQVSSLSQADKAVLRYIAIMKQTTNIQGNLAQTITSPANQIRMLKAELDQLAKSVGSLLYPALSSILPPLIAAVELIKEFVQWVGKLMGVNIQFTDFSKMKSDVGGVSDAMDDTTDSTQKAAKALKDYTMGFDELNIIDPTQGSSGSGSGSGATGNILGNVDLSGYDMFKDYIGNSVDEIKAKLESMKGVIVAIGIALAGLSLAKFLTDVSNAIAKMSDLQKLALTIATVVIEAVLVFQFSKDYASSGNPLELLGEVVAAAFGSFVLWKAIGADGISLGMGVAFVASFAGLTYALGTGTAKIDSPSTWIQGILTTVFGSIAGITLLTNLGVGTAMASTLSIGIASIITLAGITYGASASGQLLEGSFTDKLIKGVMAVIGAALGAGAAILLGASLPVAGFAAGIGLSLAVIINKVAIKFGQEKNGVDAMSGADAGINKIDDWFQKKIEGLKENWRKSVESLGEAFDSLGEVLDGLSDDLKQWFIGVGEWWDEKWAGFKTNFETAWNSLPGFVQHPIESLNEASENIKNWFVGVGKWWDEKWEGFKTNFEEGWDSLPGFVQHPIESLGQAAEGLKQWFSDVCDWWYDKWSSFKTSWDKSWNSLVDTVKGLPEKFFDYGKNIVQGLIDGISKGWTLAKNTASGLAKVIIDKFTEIMGIHSPSKTFEQYGIYTDLGFANGLRSGLEYVENAMNNVANVVKQKGMELIDAGAESATNYVNGFINGLDNNTESFKSSLQNDLFGTIKSLADAFKKGDGKTIGSAIVAVIWDAMGDKNRSEVKTFANNLTSNLSSALKKIANSAFNTASKIGENIWSGITSHFDDIVNSVSNVGNSIYKAFSSLSGPLSQAATQISNGLLGGLLSKFPEILAGVASVVTSIGGAFTGILESIGGVLTGLGIPTGALMIAGGIAIAAAIAGIVASLGASYASSDSSGYDSSNYTGTSSYEKNYGSSSYSGSYSGTSGTNSEEMRNAVYNGCYNAFLDIWQRYSEQITNGQKVTVVLDNKQIATSVEKQQSDRGMQIMGKEVYSY